MSSQARDTIRYWNDRMCTGESYSGQNVEAVESAVYKHGIFNVYCKIDHYVMDLYASKMWGKRDVSILRFLNRENLI